MKQFALGFFTTAIFAAATASAAPSFFPTTGPVVPGSRAVLRGGSALAPAQAPLAVKRAIWAANQLTTKPYRYGGGHRSFHDSAYDCSGTISYALGGAGLVPSRGNVSGCIPATVQRIPCLRYSIRYPSLGSTRAPATS